MEINLMDMYPKVNRDTKKRLKEKTPEMIAACKKIDWEYFDRKGYCYNGYVYDGRWIPIAKRFIEYYNLKPGAKILDIGCAKGYLVYDLVNLGMDAYGIDISEYAINCVPTEVKDRVHVRDVRDLSIYKDKEFDLVLGLNVLENMEEQETRACLREIERIGKNSYLKLDSWRNDEEKQRFMEWNITPTTYGSTEYWMNMFDEEGFTGDYYWFIP